MTRLKTDMLVGAAIRRAGAELIDCVMLRRGHADAGAILVHIDALDGRHMLLARSLEFDGSYVWRPVIAGPAGDGWAARDAVEAAGHPKWRGSSTRGVGHSETIKPTAV